MTTTYITNWYQILETIGQGGIGIIYRCLDRITHTEVALKRIYVFAPNYPMSSETLDTDEATPREVRADNPDHTLPLTLRTSPQWLPPERTLTDLVPLKRISCTWLYPANLKSSHGCGIHLTTYKRYRQFYNHYQN